MPFNRHDRQPPIVPYHLNATVNFLRRYWAAGLVLVIVVIHAAIIGYMRTSVARLSRADGDTVEIGKIRFQTAADLTTIYQLRIHAVTNPSRRFEAEQVLKRKRVEIQEAAEQMLRQANTQWLSDPVHAKLRDRLLETIVQQLSEPLISRVLITDWLELPAGTVATASLVSAP